MTDVSEHMYDVICKYCGNCQDKKCLANVPWYCCSIGCVHFLEEKIESLKKRKRSLSMKQIIKRYAVETV